MLEPAFRLQTTLRRRIMGEKFWKRKENQISNKERDGELKRQREERRLMRERRSQIRKEIGWFNYCFKSRDREKAANELPLPVVTLNDSGEVKVEWRYTLDIIENCESEEME